MPIAIVLIIIILIVNFNLFAQTNTKSKEQINNLKAVSENTKEQLQKINSRIEARQCELSQLIDGDISDIGIHTDEVKQALNEISKDLTSAQALQKALRTSAEDARDQVDKHRRIQNMFLGGANDLSSLSYYKRENEMLTQIREVNHNQISISIDPYLLGKAKDYLRRHTN